MCFSSRLKCSVGNILKVWRGKFFQICGSVEKELCLLNWVQTRSCILICVAVTETSMIVIICNRGNGGPVGISSGRSCSYFCSS